MGKEINIDDEFDEVMNEANRFRTDTDDDEVFAGDSNAEKDQYESETDQERERSNQAVQQARQEAAELAKERDNAIRFAKQQSHSVNTLAHKVKALESDHGKRTAQKVENYYHGVVTNLRNAKEDGNTDAEMHWTEKLAEIKAEQLAARQYAHYQKQQAAKNQRDQQLRQQQAQQQAAAQQQQLAKMQENTPKAALQWVQKNKWFTDKKYSQSAAVARAIDKSLEKEGFDKFDSSYYDELDVRLGEVIPSMKNSKRSSGSPKRSSVAPTPGQRRSRGRTRSNSMTKEEFDLAKTIGEDLGLFDSAEAAEAYKFEIESTM